MKLVHLAQLNFIPVSRDLGLLVLRVWLGLALLLLHGLGKLQGFATLSAEFPDPLGIGSQASLGLAVAAEVAGTALLVLGLFTRPAAAALAATMGVAFFIVHKGSLAAGPGSGELAFVYLAGFTTLLIAGAGRFSLDAKLGAKT